MPAVTSSLRFTLLLVGVFAFVSAEKIIITADPGENISLPCRAPHTNILVVKWSRADLEPEYVLLYRDEHFDPEEQHPSFKNRVDLQDRQMKDGDVSVILKNVMIYDTGTYVCQVFMAETRSWKLLSIITLRVVAPPGPTGGLTEDGGKEDGAAGLIVNVSVFAVLLVAAVVGFVIYRKCRTREFSYMPIDQECGQPLRSTQNYESDDLKRRRTT